MAGVLVASVDDSGVGLLRLDDPDTRNSLSVAMREALLEGLERFDPDPEVRCIVLAGSEQVFAAGADIRAMAEPGMPAPSERTGPAFWQRIAAVKTPILAAVCGYALGGGCELALACDMIVADEGAVFGQPEIRLGIIPGGGGTQRLTRAIGKQRAMEYVLTGRRFDAATAHAWGLVNKVAERGSCLDEAQELARIVAERPSVAARLAKRAVLGSEELGMTAGLAAERELFDEAMATEDRVEGMRAFLEKREPNFRGR
ncbi:MAG: enoyl-CoA hydratase/isomerase family protein [Solirubrobacterales bacterium]|nr:enoyl-CoA hydratase/isomerase family protein [Solirubrobacterales bacterium]